MGANGRIGLTAYAPSNPGGPGVGMCTDGREIRLNPIPTGLELDSVLCVNTISPEMAVERPRRVHSRRIRRLRLI